MKFFVTAIQPLQCIMILFLLLVNLTFFFFKNLGTSVLHEVHKMTGLRQLVHLVTKITVTHLLELIHHCKWSVPFLCLLATAYPLARAQPRVSV